MTKSEVALVAVNVLTVMMAMVGLSTQHPEPMSIALSLAVFAALGNSVALLRRRPTEPAPARGRARRASREDEMDPRTVLDIDARLEALEREARETREEARIRQMVAHGELSAPEADPQSDSSPDLRRERA